MKDAKSTQCPECGRSFGMHAATCHRLLRLEIERLTQARARDVAEQVKEIERLRAALNRRTSYYVSILNRIANGWDSPQSLAKLAAEHEFHEPTCASEKPDWEQGVCDCEVSRAADETSTEHGK
jgi:hypothetical protein